MLLSVGFQLPASSNSGDSVWSQSRMCQFHLRGGVRCAGGKLTHPRVSDRRPEGGNINANQVTNDHPPGSRALREEAPNIHVYKYVCEIQEWSPILRLASYHMRL
jgi:hypothetical protein